MPYIPRYTIVAVTMCSFHKPSKICVTTFCYTNVISKRFIFYVWTRLVNTNLYFWTVCVITEKIEIFNRKLPRFLFCSLNGFVSWPFPVHCYVSSLPQNHICSIRVHILVNPSFTKREKANIFVFENLKSPTFFNLTCKTGVSVNIKRKRSRKQL